MLNISTKFSRRALFAGIGDGVMSTSGAAAETNNCPRVRFIIFQDAGGYWRWRLCAGNGRQIAEHNQRYDSKQACRRGIETVQNYHDAEIVDEDACGSNCKRG